VGGVQLPDDRFGVVHDGTVISYTRAKRPVACMVPATRDAWAAVMFGLSVKDEELDPPEPPRVHHSLRSANLEM